MSLKWKGPLLNGVNSLRGNTTVDFANWEGLRFPDQSQIVDSPIGPDWKAVRCEVKFGDKDPRYSDQRIILDVSSLKGIGRVDEGDETWTRWIQMWPDNWVGKFPKWDELNSWPNIFHSGGSSGEWHHGPINEDWSNAGGSAPIYMGALDDHLWFSLVDQKTSTTRKSYDLGKLVRGKWYEHLVHAKWSSDPKKALTEVWIDGVQIFSGVDYNLFPNCYNWFLTGLYRNLNIGGQVDQNGNPLVWPIDAKPNVDYGRFVPKKGQLVYPEDDGFPQQTYFAGGVIGDTRDDVMGAYTFSDSSANVTPPVPQNDPYKAEVWRIQLVNQKPQLENIVSQLASSQAQLKSIQDMTQKILDDTIAILNKGH